jgi:hypothetical protein
MGKAVPDAVIDLLLAGIATGDRLCVCSDEPTTAAEATSTYMLVNVTITPGDGNGVFVIAAGDTSGRKVTVAQQANKDITNSGAATHVAIVTNGGVVKHVTTCTSQQLTAGGTVTIGAYTHEVRDPT